MPYYFLCKSCEKWVDRAQCPINPSHKLGPKTLHAKPPKPLLKIVAKTAEDVGLGKRKPSVPVPMKELTFYKELTKFRIKTWLTGEEETKGTLNFWFSHGNKLYEAIVGHRTGEKVTVDGLCFGKHGGKKTHIKSAQVAKSILKAAGYELE